MIGQKGVVEYFLFLIILLLFPSTVVAQVETIVMKLTEEVLKFIIPLVASGVFVLFALLLARFGKITSAKISLALGIIGFFIVLCALLYLVILPAFWKPVVEFKVCEVFLPEVDWLTLEGFAQGSTHLISCSLTGFIPVEVGMVYLITYLIFGLVLPIILLTAIFWEYIPEELVKSERVKKALTLVAVLFAYRAFVAAHLLELFAFGFGGIGAFIIAGLFVSMMWNAASRYVEPLKGVREAMRAEILAELKRLEEEYEKFRRASDMAKAMGRKEEARKCSEQAESTWKKMEELRKRGIV